jgi:hypothetical protein
MMYDREFKFLDNLRIDHDLNIGLKRIHDIEMLRRNQEEVIEHELVANMPRKSKMACPMIV